MPDDFELEIEDPKNPEIIVDNSGGEGGSKAAATGSKAVTAEDINALKAELEAAKADSARRKTSEDAAHAQVADVTRQSQETIRQRTSEIEQRIDEQIGTVKTAILSATSEVEQAKARYAASIADGKWAEAADANEAMQDAKIRLRDLSYQDQQLGQAKTRAKAEAERPVTTGVPSKTLAWIKSHPKFDQTSGQFNQGYYNKAMAAHFAALDAGVQAESDDYFKRIEEATGDRQREVRVDDTTKNTNTGEGEARGKSPADGGDNTSRNSSGVAPVTRRASGNGGTDGSGRKVIKLSGDQVEAADSLFGDPSNTLMYIKDPKERYTYWHTQQERLKSEGRIS